MYTWKQTNHKRIFPSNANFECTLKIGKCTPRVHVSQVGNPWFGSFV